MSFKKRSLVTRLKVQNSKLEATNATLTTSCAAKDLKITELQSELAKVREDMMKDLETKLTNAYNEGAKTTKSTFETAFGLARGLMPGAAPITPLPNQPPLSR